MEAPEGIPFHAWEVYYLIVGTAAGALTGLQFVVLTLVSEAGRIGDSGETLSAFGSPNVVHFCTALLISAVVSVPWTAVAPLAVAVALVGLGGFLYTIAVMRRALRQTGYTPVLEDWLGHCILPLGAYASQVVAGVRMGQNAPDGLFIVAGSALLLVFIGIHNAWDTVMYITVERAKARRAKAEAERKAAVVVLPPIPPPPP